MTGGEPETVRWKRAARIAMRLVAAWLLVSFVYTAIDLAPWEPAHPHNIFGGWKGVFTFFVAWPALDIYEHRDSLFAMASRTALLIMSIGFVFWLSGRIGRPPRRG